MAIDTVDNFLAWLAPEGTQSANRPRYTTAAAAATVAIQQHLQRHVDTEDATATARTFRPLTAGSRLLTIHDCTTITAVTENGTTLTAGTDYQAEPVNGLDRTGATVPYTALRRLGGPWYYDDDTATVSVTAKWGWAAIPDPIIMAFYLLTKDIALARELRGDVAGFNDFGAVRIRQNSQIASLLAPYRSVESWGIG